MTRNRYTTAAFLVGWATTCTVVLAGLMRSHWVPLPVPAAGDAVAAAAGEWTAWHVLAADCGCSRRVLARLVRREPVAGVNERVVWVGDGEPVPPMPDGFDVECLTAADLATRHHIEAVPVLVVIAPDGVVRYRGGYTARKQGFDIQDRQIITAVRRGEPTTPLPVYGCASSDRLKAAESLLPAWIRGDAP
jgi:hypothetical protein